MITPLPWRHLLWALLLTAAARHAPAQAAPYEPPNLKMVLFGGYSLVSIKPGTQLDRLSQSGWAASITSYHTFRRWGLTAEFGGSGKQQSSQQSYLFGGTFRGLQKRRLALTGRILAGSTRWLPEAPVPGAYRRQTAFTFGFGQAIDLKFSENLSLRVQPDLRFVRFQEPGGSSKLTLVRPLSIGLAYQFGNR